MPTLAFSAAGPDTPTCRSCTGGNCENNILPDVLQQGLLTSGYFSITSSAKPAGDTKEPTDPRFSSQMSLLRIV